MTAQNAALAQGAAPTAEDQTASLVAVARSALANFAVASDQESANLAQRGYSVAAYAALPRITTFTSHLVTTGTQSTVSYSIDLVKDALLTIVAPGQNVKASFVFASVRGVYDSFLEGQVLQSGGQDMSAATIVAQAMSQGIPLAVITSANLSLLQTMNLPVDAVARITANVQNGLTVITSFRPRHR